LLEISIILLNRKSTTAKELAERFNVSTRTIYRDIDVLSSAGVPVYMSKGKGGGIFLLEDYYISGATITGGEVESINVALKTLQATKYPEIDSILDKLGSVFKNGDIHSTWIDIDFTPWGSDPNESDKFLNIKNAIISRRVIKFSYMSSYGKSSERELEPLKLWYKGNGWYLWGFCRDKQDFRVFRITRIKGLEITDEAFTPKDIEKAEENRRENQKLPTVTMKLKFSPSALYRVYDDFDSEHIELSGDGSAIVTVDFPFDEWIFGYMLSLGPDMEVLEPASLRKELRKRAEKIIDNYTEKL